MVLVKRHSTLSSVPISTIGLGSNLLPYGDNVTPQYLKSPDSVSPESGIRRKFSFDKDNERKNASRTALYAWIYRAIFTFISVWWIGSRFWTSTKSQQSTTAATTPLEWKSQHQQPGVRSNSLSESQYSNQGLEGHVSNLELKVHHEPIDTTNVASPDAGPKITTRLNGIVDRWIEHRLTVLENKVQTLQKYITESSRNQVVEKFGYGPTYKVKFTVELVRLKAIKSFVIETAPLDLAPHSVHVFLEMVDRGLWDNTVFWHHDDSNHVISSAPVIYSTGMPNHHHFEALGLLGVSFAEYSSSFPHTKYTLGFAHRGPVFYINTMNNTELHGPGGQGHHDFPEEADPCFGRIIHGFDVVDEMYRLSLEPKPQQGEHRDWHEYDLTHIIGAVVLSES